MFRLPQAAGETYQGVATEPVGQVAEMGGQAPFGRDFGVKADAVGLEDPGFADAIAQADLGRCGSAQPLTGVCVLFGGGLHGTFLSFSVGRLMSDNSKVRPRYYQMIGRDLAACRHEIMVSRK